MKNICILLPAKNENNEVKKYIENYLKNNEIDSYIGIYDFNIKSNLNYESNIKLQRDIIYITDNFYNDFEKPKKLIIIISDYNLACLLKNIEYIVIFQLITLMKKLQTI